MAGLAEAATQKKKPPLGTGERSANLRRELESRGGVKDVGALIGSIGRKKYGAHRMAEWAAKSRAKG